MSETKAPHNLAAEAAIIGAILFENGVYDRVREMLHPDDFYSSAHSMIYQRLAAVIESGQVADGVTLHEWFEKEPVLKDVGGARYLADLLDSAVFGLEINDYSQMIRELSVQRELLGWGGYLTEKITGETGASSKDLVAEAHDALQKIEDRKLRASAWEPSSASVTRIVDELDDRVRNGKGADVMGHPTGLPDLDKRIGGLRPGNLIILAGRPGMAKSGVAGNISASVAGDGKVVGFFSLEMEKRELDLRLMSQMARKVGAGKVEYVSAINGGLGQNELAILRVGAGAIPQTLYVDDTAFLTVPDIAARARALKRKAGRLDLLVIDYLQIMNLQLQRGETMATAVGRNTSALKRLAKDLHAPVIALSQLSRECERREDKRPMLSDLRDSGAIEQDADVVVFVYRDEYYLEKEEPPNHQSPDWNQWYAALGDSRGKMELIAAKVRMGRPGRVHVYYEAATDSLVSKKAELIEEGLV